nr:MAG TPA: hypothetical protein [Caudoviricetes sp.]
MESPLGFLGKIRKCFFYFLADSGQSLFKVFFFEY